MVQLCMSVAGEHAIVGGLPAGQQAENWRSRTKDVSLNPTNLQRQIVSILVKLD